MHRLRDQLYYCYSGGRAIFLDAGGGRYFCLPPAGETAFLDFQNGSASDDQFDWLKSKNILVESNGQPCPSASTENIARPIDQLDMCARPTAFDMYAAMSARVSTHLLLRYRGFGWAYRSILAGKAKQNPADKGDRIRDTTTIAAAFQKTDILLGNTDRCLPRSLAFLRLCNARRHFPSLVIGVRTNPFTAHAWVQCEGMVLNDSVDQVRVFTPILVL